MHAGATASMCHSVREDLPSHLEELANECVSANQYVHWEHTSQILV